MAVEESYADVLVIGSGLAGSLTALALTGQGHDVLLLEHPADTTHQFVTEKIEPEQAARLRALDFLEHRVPAAAPIGTTLNFDGHQIGDFDTVEQYGISYNDTVDRLREVASEKARIRATPVAALLPDPVSPAVRLSDGSEISAGLVILATSGLGHLVDTVSLQVQTDPSLVSLTYRFGIEGPGADFTGFNYFLGKNPGKVDYLTTFRVGDHIRANLFTQQHPTDLVMSKAASSMDETLKRWFPEIEVHLGSVYVSSSVETFATTYQRIRDPGSASGVVILGDAFQSSNPTTGMGLTRILTDVQLLCERHAPKWLATGRTEVRAFYGDPEKLSTDREAHDRWCYYRDRQTWDRVPLYLRAIRKAKDLGLGRSG